MSVYISGLIPQYPNKLHFTWIITHPQHFWCQEHLLRGETKGFTAKYKRVLRCKTPLSIVHGRDMKCLQSRKNTSWLAILCVYVCLFATYLEKRGASLVLPKGLVYTMATNKFPSFFVLCVCAAPATPLLQSIGLLILRISLTSLASQVEILAEHGRNILRLVVLESIVDGILAQKAVDCTVVSLAR